MRLTRLLSGFVFFVAMAVTSVQAQTESPARINWGPISPEPNNTMATKVVGLTPDGYYLLRQKVLQSPSVRPRAWVEFATKDLKVTRSEELDLKYKGKQRDFEDLIYYNGQLYLLTSFNNTAHKKNYLFLQKVSTRGLTASKSLKMIAETEARNKEVEGSFAVDISKARVQDAASIVHNGRRIVVVCRWVSTTAARAVVSSTNATSVSLQA